jgi:hypothetical protein
MYERYPKPAYLCGGKVYLNILLFILFQVFSRASDQESCGWWRAIVKMIKGDFHVVEYLGNCWPLCPGIPVRQ